MFSMSLVADETQESLHTDNETEQSTEEFLLTDNDYDVLPSRKGVYKDIFWECFFKYNMVAYINILCLHVCILVCLA